MTMYGHKARNTLIALLKESPELKVGEPPKSVVTPTGYRKIADRLLVELWMHGFAVSARKVGARAPKDAPDHKEWRDKKLAPALAKAERRRQKDVEGVSDPAAPPARQARSDEPARSDHPSAAASEAARRSA
jgi:hypothetical protein